MEQYWRWLSYQKKILPPQAEKCMEYFQTPENMFIAPEREIRQLDFLSAPAREELLRTRTEKELLREEKELSEKGIRYLSREHPEYPRRLKEISCPPLGLFIRGRLPEERRKGITGVAIVGARWATHGGLMIARQTAKRLSESGVTVYSGMASGIDGAAQEAALSEQGKSVGVLGCGADICYPSHNRGLYETLMREGAVVSEYPPGTPPAAFRFPYRNRIISGMADVVLVVEARKKSGSLITADYALDQGKEVFAVPGRIDEPLSEGCNRLIAQGAGIYCSLEDFLKDLKISGKEEEKFRKKQLTLAKSEDMVYSCVDFRGQNLETICSKTGLSREETLRALFSLELMDLIEEKARLYYKKQ